MKLLQTQHFKQILSLVLLLCFSYSLIQADTNTSFSFKKNKGFTTKIVQAFQRSIQREMTMMGMMLSSGSVSSRVNSGNNDAEENLGTGSVSLSSSDLELSSDGGTNQIIGMRFNNMNIPQGATITSAYIEFEVDEVDSGTTSLTFSAEDIDDAPVFTTTNGNLSSRTPTSNTTPWNNVSAWNAVSAKQQTPDLSLVIQEVVDRAGWTYGNSLAILVTGSGERTAESYNGENANAPLLVVNYSTHNSTCSSNALSNPDFESGFTGWNNTNSVLTDDAYSGDQAVVNTGSNGGVAQDYAGTPGVTYTLEAYGRKTGTAVPEFGIKFFDASWNDIGGRYVNIESTDWELYRIAVTAPANTVHVQAIGWSSLGTGNAYFDDFCFDTWSFPPVFTTNTFMEVEPSFNRYIFSMDDSGSTSNWLDYDRSDMVLEDNGDGTLTLKGNVIMGRDADWHVSNGVECGVQDGWYLEFILSNMQTWNEFQGNTELNPSCPNAYTDLDYWDLAGTMTGLGCNAGRTINITGPNAGYRMQIGMGGNSHNCGYGMSTWITGDENGTQVGGDLYANIEEISYLAMRPNCSTSGNADAVISQVGVGSETQALGTPNNTPALLYDTNDQIVLDLTDELPTGTDYIINWRKDPGTSGDPQMVIEESTDGSTWSAASGSPYTLTNTTYHTQTIATSTNTRYLRFTNQNVYNVDLDAISYTTNCSTGGSTCNLTNPFPGFPIDFLNNNTGWIDYNLGNDLTLTDNGDGTQTITGSITDGTPIDFGSGSNGTSCGATDGWTLNLTLSDKMTWTEFQNAGGSANVHANCNADIADLDYWDISGTLTGTGCNSGRTLTITGPKAPYRLQIGYGANNGDGNCDFGMSTWFDINENGTDLNADIYAFLDENCYNPSNPTDPPTTNNCPNDLTNSEFDNSTNDWDFYINGGSGNLSVDNTSQLSGANSAEINITSTNGTEWHLQLAQVSKTLIAGTTYAIEFDAKAASARNISASLQLQVSPFTGYWYESVALTTTGTRYSYEFTPNTTVNNQASLVFNVAQSSETVYIDNIFFGEVCPEDEVIINSTTVSNCINQPLQDVATVDVNVSWATPAPSNTIEFAYGDKIEYLDISSLSSPQTVQLVVAADGSTNNALDINFSGSAATYSTTYNAPAACSSDEIACNILYLCGEEKPYDGDPWDHGWVEYLDAVNGASTVTPILTKADGSGMGTYDINNTSTFVNVTLTDYDLIIVSATTENYIATDLVDALKDTPVSVLNSNYLIINDLGMSNVEGSYTFKTTGYTDNTTEIEIYNYDNINPDYNYVFTHGDYLANGDGSLWANANDQSNRLNGYYFAYDATDALTGASSSHGNRVYLGYHMNGLYANPVNGGALPAPVSTWFNPIHHLTLEGKNYFDQAIVLAASGCASEICGNGIDDDGDGLIDSADPDCALNSDVCYIISDGTNDGYLTQDTLYTVNPITGAITAVGPTGTHTVEAMAIDTVNKIMYAIANDTLVTINPTTGTSTVIGVAGSVDINGAVGLLDISDVDGLTYDYTNQILWGSERRDGENGDPFLPDDLIIQIDPATGLVIEDAFGANVDYLVVATSEHDLDDITILGDGTLYAISNQGASGNQTLGVIDKTTGAFTAIGDHGVEDIESLTLAGTGQFIATSGDSGKDKNSFFSIDPTTAEAIHVASILPASDVEACACGNNSSFVNSIVSGKVWADLDGDGIQDLEEPGVKKATVNLLDNSGSPVLDANNNPLVTTTNNSGIYLFDRLPAGDYIVEFVAPTGATITLKDQGGNDDLDSDANTANGRTDAFNVALGVYKRSVDAGLQNAAVITRTCADSDNLLVIEESGYVVRFNGSTGALLDTFIYDLNTPRDLVVSPDSYLYVSDEDNHAIYKYSLVTGALMQIFTDQLNKPNGMVFDDNGFLYVNNRGADNVLRFDPNNSNSATVFVATGTSGLDGNRGGIVFGADGNLYVASRYGNNILRFNGTTGAFIDEFVAAGSGGLSNPLDINFGPDGNLYVTSSTSDNVLRYNGTTGAFIDIFIATGSGGLDNPYKFQFGPDGDLYVTDQASSLEVLRYNGTTGAFIEIFTSGLTLPQGLLFAPVPGCACSVAGPLIVNSIGDEADTNPGDGICQTVQCDCTLRAAIEEANALAGKDTIYFDIYGNGPHTIIPMSDYEYISEAVYINGYSQPDATVATINTPATIKIEIDGSNLTSAQGIFHTTANDCEFSGMAINGHDGAIAGAAITFQSDNNHVWGCHIGTNPAGTVAIQNARGIRVWNADNCTIGGSTPAERNVISGNEYIGVSLEKNGFANMCDNTTIEGNFIGTDAAGTSALGNLVDGIDCGHSRTTSIINNVISGNGQDGIEADGGSNGTQLSSGVIQGNMIGTDASGTLDLGNGFRGILVRWQDDMLIGGLNAGEENYIVHNDATGITVHEEETDNVRILRNIIYDNANLGIDLSNGFGADYVTSNDANDSDTGANDLLNFPSLDEFKLNGSDWEYSFDLDLPTGDYRIELFKNTIADNSNHGEGEVFIGAININHPGTGVVNYSGVFTPLVAVNVGEFIAATTTECTDGTCTDFTITSEFSNLVEANSCEDEICGNGIDDDCDGDTDCDDSDCNPFSLTANETTCTSHGDGTFTAQYDLVVNWISTTHTGNVEVTWNGTNVGTFDISSTTAPHTINLNIPADGMGQEVFTVNFVGSACTTDLTIDSPAVCPTPTGNPSGESCETLTTTEIGGTVFLDNDFDGTMNAGTDTIGLRGFIVNIYDRANNLIQTVYTDIDGNYIITGLDANAKYRIEIAPSLNQKDDYVPTVHGADNNTSVNFTKAGECIHAAFGQPAPNSPLEIGDIVWIDYSRDGLQNADEAPIADVILTLYDAATGTVLAEETTTDGGAYHFNDASITAYTNLQSNGSTAKSGNPPATQLLPNTDYIIVISGATNGSWSVADGRLTVGGKTYEVSDAVQGGNTSTDSDGIIGDNTSPLSAVTNGYIFAAVTTGDAGTVDHSIDFGLVGSEICGNGTDDDGDGLIDELDIDCCDNITDAGLISGDEVTCSAYDMDIITEVEEASGGSRDLNYQWQSSTDGVNYADIVGATTATYDPGIISQTTYFRRGAYRTDCSNPVYSNVITKTVDPTLLYCPEIEDWSFECQDGFSIAPTGMGIKGIDEPAMRVLNPSFTDMYLAEATFSGGNGSPESVTFRTKEGYTQTVNKIYFFGESGTNGDRYFRAMLPPTDSVYVDYEGNDNRGESLVVFSIREQAKASSHGKFEHRKVSPGESYSFSFDLPTILDHRDVYVSIPIAELTNDGRVVNVTVSAGGVSATETISNFEDGNSLDLVYINLENVQPEATELTITAESPEANGQSFYITGAAVATVTCDADLVILAEPDIECAMVGETITYTYQLYNFGDDYVAGLSANSTLIGDIDFGVDTIHANSQLTASQTYTIQASDLPGPVVNPVRALGWNFATNGVKPIHDSDTSRLELVDLVYTMSADKTMAVIGDTVTYTYNVTNQGSERISTNLIDSTGQVSDLRITDELQALYTFSEGGGNIIQDVSGVGVAMDLTIEDPSNVIWNSNSLVVNDDTEATNSETNNKLYQSIAASGAMTIEAWVKPENNIQDGPARIAALSVNSNNRNFVLGQEGEEYAGRVKTTDNGTNQLETNINAIPATPIWQHVIYTYDGTNAKLFVDGNEVSTSGVDNPLGDISNWENNATLILFNENNASRYWQGEIGLLAMYSKVLNNTEIQQNYDLGYEGSAFGTIEPGQTLSYTTQHIITESDLPSPLVNTGDLMINGAGGCERTLSETVEVLICTNPTCTEICDNGIDDDGDGLNDCDDPDCMGDGMALAATDDNYHVFCPGLDYTGNVLSNDVNYGVNPTITITTAPTAGIVAMDNTGTFTYTPNAYVCNTDQFVYEVCNSTTGCCVSATVTINYSDTQFPTLIGVPADDIVFCDEIVPRAPYIQLTDNCSGLSLDFTETDTQGEDGCSLHDYTITRTWVASDACGNQTTDTQIVDVMDVTAPDIYRIYTLPNGKKMVAGVMENVTERWKTIQLPIDFPTKPVIFTQVTSVNEASTVTARIRNTSISQFEMRLQEEEAADNDHQPETVAWIAVEVGTNSIDNPFEVAKLDIDENFTNVSFVENHTGYPIAFTGMQTTRDDDAATVRYDNISSAGMDLTVQEETSVSADVTHTPEEVAYWAINTPGIFSETDVLDGNGDLIGEKSFTFVETNWKIVTFNNTYHNPVLLATGLTYQDADPVTVRVRNVTSTGFEMRLEEWNSQDGIHPVEYLGWMVIEGSLPLVAAANCDAVPAAPIGGIEIIAVDNCDISVPLTFNESENFTDCANRFIERSWVATDECGNSTVYTKTIQVTDPELPSFTVPADVMISCNADINNLALTGDITNISDNCSSSLTPFYTDDVSALSSCNQSGQVFRTWRVTDECGNAFEQTQIITIDDSDCGGCEIYVNTTDDVDDGECTTEHCSLREAINESNNSVGLDTIRFLIPGTDVQTIIPLTPLPPVTEEVFIDATTQPEASCPDNLLIELDGSALLGLDEHGLEILADNVTIKGFIINRFPANGIAFAGVNSGHVQCSYLGTGANGVIARPNAKCGVALDTNTNNVIIGTNEDGIDDSSERNVISGNTLAGVSVQGGDNNLIVGNQIGADKNGVNPVPNGTYGVEITGGSKYNRIGGKSTATENIISGNTQSGIRISSTHTDFVTGEYTGNDTIQYNRIGWSANDTPLGNGENGILIELANEIHVTNNKISTNSDYGIQVKGAKVEISDNLLQDNEESGIVFEIHYGSDNNPENEVASPDDILPLVTISSNTLTNNCSDPDNNCAEITAIDVPIDPVNNDLGLTIYNSNTIANNASPALTQLWYGAVEFMNDNRPAVAPFPVIVKSSNNGPVYNLDANAQTGSGFRKTILHGQSGITSTDVTTWTLFTQYELAEDGTVTNYSPFTTTECSNFFSFDGDATTDLPAFDLGFIGEGISTKSPDAYGASYSVNRYQMAQLEDCSDRDRDGSVDEVDLDDDNDGIADVDEGTEDLDGDGIPNDKDLDSDNDGIPDIIEAGFHDQNGDGLVDNLGLPGWDDDNDGWADGFDANDEDPSLSASNTFDPTTFTADRDGDGAPNYQDLDSDNDGLPDLIEAGGVDTNGDGQVDYAVLNDPMTMIDNDNDGFTDLYDPDYNGSPGADDTTLPLVTYNGNQYSDATGNRPDADNDNVPNFWDLDSDNDGLPDLIEQGGVDTDGNGVVDAGEWIDINNNGFHDNYENQPLILTEADDGVGNVRPIDNDGDGTRFPKGDYDADDIPNAYDLESDGDGINDLRETAGVVADVDNDGVIDIFNDSNDNGCDDDVEALPLLYTETDGNTDDGRPEDGVDANSSAYDTAMPDGTLGVVNGEPDVDNDGDSWINAQDLDSDNDLLADNIEDKNTDGITDAGETDPYNEDTDDDLLTDGVEDENKDGIYDEGPETDPLNPDTDGDSLEDGTEDSSHDGYVNGAESDPRDPCDPYLSAQCIGVNLNVRVHLFGALTASPDGLMRDDLRKQNFLPMKEPYSALESFAHYKDGGGETTTQDVFDVIGDNAIVDWVMVELRNPLDSSDVVATRSGLLQRDGDVVDMDGVSALNFPSVIAGSYFVSVRHRNHLGVCTSSTQVLTKDVTLVDFTLPTTLVFGDDSRAYIQDKWALWGGDLSSDGNVIYQGPQNDIFEMLLKILTNQENTQQYYNYIIHGYHNQDFDLNGNVIYQGPDNDRSKVLFNIILAHPHNVNGFPNFIISTPNP